MSCVSDPQNLSLVGDIKSPQKNTMQKNIQQKHFSWHLPKVRSWHFTSPYLAWKLPPGNSCPLHIKLSISFIVNLFKPIWATFRKKNVACYGLILIWNEWPLKRLSKEFLKCKSSNSTSILSQNINCLLSLNINSLIALQYTFIKNLYSSMLKMKIALMPCHAKHE